jgi:hypothetical protein
VEQHNGAAASTARSAAGVMSTGRFGGWPRLTWRGSSPIWSMPDCREAVLVVLWAVVARIHRHGQEIELDVADIVDRRHLLS